MICPSSSYIIPPGKYDDLDYLKEGRALVKQDSRYGFVDKNGQIVIDLQYDYATSFANGAAAVFKDGKLSFIDKEGNVMVEPVEVDVDAEEIFLHYFKEPGIYKSLDYSYFDKDGWIRKL